MGRGRWTVAASLLLTILPLPRLQAQEVVPIDVLGNRSTLQGTRPGGRNVSLLACGASLPGRIAASGQVRRYEFAGVAGEVVDLVLVEDEAGFAGTLAQASLRGPSGTEIGRFAGTRVRSFSLPATGSYELAISASGAGDFHVGLGCPPPKRQATPLAPEQLTQGTLQRPGELAYYTFQGLPTEVVSLSLTALDGFQTSVPRATVFAPDGKLLATLDGGEVETLVLNLPGTYSLRVQSNTLRGSGSFGVGYYRSPPAVMAQPLGCGQVVEELIVLGGGLEWFSFDGDIDETIELALVVTGGFQSGVPQMRIHSPSGRDLGLYSADSIEPFQLTETGTYYVQVAGSQATASGGFALGLSCRPPLGAAQALTCGGAPVVGSISTVGEVQYLTFDANIGETAELTFTTLGGFPNSKPQMEVFSPSGVDLGAFNADTGSSQPIAIQETGTYAVRVLGNDLKETGSFSLALQCLPPPFAAVFLGANSLNPGRISASGEVDTYAFDGEMGEIVDLTLVESGFSSSSANARATLFSPGGSNLGTFDSDSLNPFVLPDTGRYTLNVRASNGTSTGNYSLGLERRLPLEPLPAPLVCGQVYPSRISKSGEVDFFTFEGSAGDVVELTLTESGFSSSSANARGNLFAPSGVAVGSSFDSNSLTGFTLPETGTYTIRIRASNLVSTGNYRIGLGCRSPLGPVEAYLVPGDLATNSVSQSAESDWFVFDGTAGDIVELMLVEWGFSSSSANARATVFTPSGGVLGSSFDSNTLIGYGLSETGSYTVRVRASNLVSTGNYRLGLESRSPLGPVEAHLVPGDLITDSLASSGESDWYTFDGTAGDVVELMLVEWGFSSSSANARATLFTPSGVVVGSSFDSNSLVGFGLSETGTYSVRVRASNLTSTGNYRLGLESRSPLGPVEAHLVPGDLVTNALVSSGQSDWFTFDGTAGDIVDLMLVEWGFSSSSANARATLFTPSGVAVGPSFDSNTLKAFTLQETGTYAVRIRASNLTSTGNYRLGMESRSPLGPVEAHLVPGDLVTSSLVSSGESDWFTFDGTAGDIVELMLVEWGFSSSSANARANLYAPSGVAEGSSFDSNSLNGFILQETGTYSVRVRASNLTSTGNYRLGLESRSPLGPVEAHLVPGDLVTNALVSSGQSDWFTFDGTAGDIVELMLVEWGFSSSSANARATLFAPSGVAVGPSFDSNTLKGFTLQETGTYAVRIRASNLTSTGNYRLGLESRSPLGPVVEHLQCGIASANSLTSSGQSDWFTFDGVAGQSISLTLTESGFSSSSANARANLFDPNGVSAGSSFDSNSTVSFTLTETGVYSIRIRASNLTSTGNYSIRLNCP